VWHDAFTCVKDWFTRATWLLQMCNMTHSHVWHDCFKCISWLIHMWSCVRCATLLKTCHSHGTWLIWKCAMTHPHVTWLMYMCEMTHSHVTWLIHIWSLWGVWHFWRRVIHMWHDSFTNVPWLIHMCHDSFTNVPWLIHMWSWIRCVTYLTCLIYKCAMTHSHVPWLIYKCAMTHSHVIRYQVCDISNVSGVTCHVIQMSHTYCKTLTHVTWLIHIGDMPHSHMWHDSFTCVTWLVHMSHTSCKTRRLSRGHDPQRRFANSHV